MNDNDIKVYAQGNDAYWIMRELQRAIDAHSEFEGRTVRVMGVTVSHVDLDYLDEQDVQESLSEA